jgi:WD40 repeat protein
VSAIKVRSTYMGHLAVLASLAFFALACGKPERPPLVDQTGPAEPRRLAFHPTDPDRLLVVEVDGTVSEWRVADPKRPEKLLSIAAQASDARFLLRKDRIVTGGRDGSVLAWDGSGRKVWRSADSHDGGVRALAVGPGLVASAGDDGTIRLWELDGSGRGSPLTGHGGVVVAVAFSPNGEWLASEGRDTIVHLWRLGAGNAAAQASRVFRNPMPLYRDMLPHLIKYDTQWGWERSLAFSPRGDLLAATGFDGTVQLWDLDGMPRSEPLRHNSYYHTRSVSFSPKGDVFATAGFDGKVQLWNLDGSPHGPPFGGPEPIAGRGSVLTSVVFAPGGKRLASTGHDETVRLWNLDGSPQGALPQRQ